MNEDEDTVQEQYYDNVVEPELELQELRSEKDDE